MRKIPCVPWFRSWCGGVLRKRREREEAARLLIEQIEEPDTWIPQQITVEGELLKGDTVADIG